MGYSQSIDKIVGCWWLVVVVGCWFLWLVVGWSLVVRYWWLAVHGWLLIPETYFKIWSKSGQRLVIAEILQTLTFSERVLGGVK